MSFFSSDTAALTILAGVHGPEITISKKELLAKADVLARDFSRIGLREGDRAAIVAPTSVEVIASLLAVWKLGAAFSVLPWSLGGSGARVATTHLAEQLQTLEPSLVITSSATAFIGVLPIFSAHSFCDLSDLSMAAPTRGAVPGPETAAFFQFTSGSTENGSRGVIVEKPQLFCSLEGLAEKASVTDRDTMVSWAPLHHDMGLVAVLLALHQGMRCVVIPTETFARKPRSWLNAISRFKGTLSPAPPFAFSLLAKRAPASDLDLSSWRHAWVGAEPIFPKQLELFENAYRAAGLRDHVLQGTYGLAEAVVVVSNGRAGQQRKNLNVLAEQIRAHGKIVACARDEPGSVALVGCGAPNKHVELRIGDEDGNELAPGRRGRILIRGGIVTPGYLGERRGSVGEWLDTGDLGFMHEGEVFIYGRSKELIKRAGRGVAPQELEWCVEELLEMKTGRSVAFSTMTHDREEIVVVVEGDTARNADQKLKRCLSEAVSREVGVEPNHFVFVDRGTLPRTSSGKLKRSVVRDRYESGQYQ